MIIQRASRPRASGAGSPLRDALRAEGHHAEILYTTTAEAIERELADAVASTRYDVLVVGVGLRVLPPMCSRARSAARTIARRAAAGHSVRMIRSLARRLRQGLVATIFFGPTIAHATPFPADSMLSVELGDAADTCRLVPEPMQGACDTIDPGTGKRMFDAMASVEKGVTVRGIALVLRPPLVHVVSLLEYENDGYAAKTEDVQRLAGHLASYGTHKPTASLRDGGPALGAYGDVRFPSTLSGQPATMGFYAFLGEPNIQVLSVATIGDESAGIAFGNELLAGARLSPQYKARSLSAPARVDVTESVVSFVTWTPIVVIGLVAIWLDRRRRKALAHSGSGAPSSSPRREEPVLERCEKR